MIVGIWLAAVTAVHCRGARGRCSACQVSLWQVVAFTFASSSCWLRKLCAASPYAFLVASSHSSSQAPKPTAPARQKASRPRRLAAPEEHEDEHPRRINAYLASQWLSISSTAALRNGPYGAIGEWAAKELPKAIVG